jgi:hypothetical protein
MGHDDKSWKTMAAKFPGINHYRNSRKWLPETPQSDSSWLLVPNGVLDLVKAEWTFGEEIRRALVLKYTLVAVTP